MSEIPFEVMMHAERLYDDGGNETVPTIIAKAILAERERIAEVVRTEPELPGEPPAHVVEAMYHAGPVMNARAAVRATKSSILQRMGAA